MNNYQVVITKHIVYEIKANDENEAEELAWNRLNEDDFSESLIAEILKVDELPIGAI